MAKGGRSRNKRSAGFMYTGLSTVMMVLVAAIAITASQTPPPAIAELAPEAVEQIKDAPPEQSSDVGSAEGGGGLGGSVTTTTTTTTTTTLVPGAPTTTAPPPERAPRVRKCIGNPPRQTEDPQSPPCVPFWEGDNGGATSKGVTRDEIKIVLPAKKSKDPRYNAAIAAHFNSRFEFYGRKITLAYLDTAGAFVSCAAMKADAVKVDEEFGAFASIFYDIQGGREPCFYDELARRGIISSQSSWLGTSAATEADLMATGPYQWNYYPAVDTVLRHVAEVVCKQLKGRISGSRPPGPRTFAVLVNASSEGGKNPDPAPLVEDAARCGVPFTVITGDFGSTGQNASLKNAIVKLRDDRINSVVCLCFLSVIQKAMSLSTAEGYYPEWITQNFMRQDDDMAGGIFPADQRTQVIGLRTWNKALPREEMPFWQAIREVDPTHPVSEHNFSPDYWSMLLLASGIQAAGPNLTPETFAAGLQRTVFPNPGCGGPPHYQACVGFRNDHAMIDDFAFVWYDNNTRSKEYDTSRSTNAYTQQAGTGAYCYVDGGKRYRLGQWPTAESKAYELPCQN